MPYISDLTTATTIATDDYFIIGGGTNGTRKVQSNLVGGGGGVVDFDAKGTVTTNITLAENKITTAHFSGTNTITLPTVTDTEKQVSCILDFTTATSSQPTITNTNIKWSSRNQGLAPTSYATTTLSGVRNILIAKSIWISSTLYWELEYMTYGGVETTFIQPVLSANGTLGGSNFAVYSSNAYNSSYQMYLAYDNNTSTYYHSASGLPTLKFYNPNALKVSALTFTNDNNTNYYITSFSLYGSNDDSIYTFINNYTNSNGTGGSTWSNYISSTEFYKYYRLNITGTRGNTYCSFAELDISATYIAT